MFYSKQITFRKKKLDLLAEYNISEEQDQHNDFRYNNNQDCSDTLY